MQLLPRYYYYMSHIRWISLITVCAGATLACGLAQRTDPQELLANLGDAGLVLGEYRLESVIDGDTIKVYGIDTSLRLLGIDTEETFKHDAERQAYAQGWSTYWAAAQDPSGKPVKVATPLGEEAKAFAEQFFAGVDRVRLERDHPKQIRGFYGRYLVYVWVERDGRWLNYNVEAVRAGMSPYFTKYGYSRRYHQEFVAAQAEAQAAARGIWDPASQHYDDYDLRLAWWNARAEFIAAFEREAARDARPHIDLSDFDALTRLANAEGREVVVLASLESLRLGDKGPSLANLARARGRSVPVIFWDHDTFMALGLERWLGEPVRAVGRVQFYAPEGRERVLQIVASEPYGVTGPSNLPVFTPRVTSTANNSRYDSPGVGFGPAVVAGGGALSSAATRTWRALP